MKTVLRFASIVTLAAALVGCSTPAACIKSNQALFDTFPPDVQERVREGNIDMGYTKDMVYIAKGDPDRRYARETALGETEVWAYVDTYTTTERQRVEGPFRYRDVDGSYRTMRDTIWVDVQQRNEYEYLRVEFKNGIVVAIERIER